MNGILCLEEDHKELSKNMKNYLIVVFALFILYCCRSNSTICKLSNGPDDSDSIKHNMIKKRYKDIIMPYFLLSKSYSEGTLGNYVDAIYQDTVLVKLITHYNNRMITDTVIYSDNEAFFVQKYCPDTAAKDKETYWVKRIVDGKLIMYWLNFVPNKHYLYAIDTVSNIVGFKRKRLINFYVTDFTDFVNKIHSQVAIDFCCGFDSLCVKRNNDSIYAYVKIYKPVPSGLWDGISGRRKFKIADKSEYFTMLDLLYTEPYIFDPFFNVRHILNN